MSEIKVNTIVDASGGNTASINGQTPTVSNMAGRNRIINGDMRIDQRNAGASVSVDGSLAYPVDRFFVQDSTDGAFTAEQVEDAPTGFYQSLKVTVTTADASLGATQYSRIVQYIEGNNVADFGLGTVGASTFTISFWTKSSLTGTFGGAVGNSADNRMYPFTYTISAANTWEQKTVTIAGDTTGTWLKTNGIGLSVMWGLGVGSTYSGTAGAWAGSTYLSATGSTSVVGTSGATFYITGVQLEAGSVATPFENVDYSEMLSRCQRYFCKTYDINIPPGDTALGGWNGAIRSTVPTTNSYQSIGNWSFPVSMRAAPTVVAYNPRTGVTNSFVGDGSDYSPVGIGNPGNRGCNFFANGVSVGTHVFVQVAATASAEL